jgi:hypothetical protein
MTGKFQDFIEKHLISDVPDSMAACLDCGFVQCLNEKWENCPNRLAHVAAIRAMRAVTVEDPSAAAVPGTKPSAGS